ncbi:hypothetical protein BV25DRAFT_1799983 [Artomyces pyxidatus]|uniref:Uncharacterized protein n=1 Tax=Artomyces pyxidatus TaxID=48021 RepID=A0ACB8T9G6_9AGAM|nr:hypothetical protein BV25DRAFT_1799983 [Artomyces pyxidatus]
MDHPALIRNLFSRGASPPGQQSTYPDQTHPPQNFQQYQHVSPAQSLREVVPSSSPTHVESLFHNLSAPGQSSAGNPSSFANPPPTNNSAPATPVSITAQSASSQTSAPTNASTESRQSALLSLLGTVSPSTNAPSAPQQQNPTPPNASHRSAPANNNESQAQGRFLLEQLMSGCARLPLSMLTSYLRNAPRTTYPESHQSRVSPSSIGPQPYPPVDLAAQHETSSYYEPEVATPHETRTEDFQNSTLGQTQQPPQQQQQQSPPPPHKALFDFVSPFDALAASTSSSTTRKPVPAIVPSQAHTDSNEDTWSAVIDPKRKSVDNLIEQLSRVQPPTAPPVQASPPYEQQTQGEDLLGSESLLSRVQSRPLPPKPTQAPSPRNSPPKISSQPPRRDIRASESPMGSLVGPPISHGPPAQNQRDKDSSPGPRGSWKGHEGRARGSGSKAKPQSSPNSQPQNIVFDVSQPLDEIQAPRDAVKSTAIALVRVDSTFLPGTTIGATHWVAYAMTKGRVRVISRSSGDRTLLQLPPVFPPTTSVTDMAVFGNRLAGVTSDGGFVVWELPDLITDDVPGNILLCVLPAMGTDALHSVKWHPRQQDTMAVASATNIYILDITRVAQMFGGEPIDQSDLPRVASSITMPSSTLLAAFDFDVAHSAIATISDDSTLSLWNARDRTTFWSTKIRGEDIPSSITFVDGGLVIGRKHGTVFQLLQSMGKNVLATVKFINGEHEDPEMFGHANYDSRIQTLWVANNRRDSMIAFKLGFEVSSPGRGEDTRGYFDQVLEFAGPKPTIHFVILTADADPTGEEAHAACVAAKVPPGDLALVAFSVHSTGVDQVLIRKEWFDGALATSLAKFPPVVAAPALVPPPPVQEPRAQRQPVQAPPPVNIIVQPVAQSSVPPPSNRLRTPPSEEVEADLGREEGRPSEIRGRGKGKNVGWKEKEEKEKAAKAAEASPSNGSESQIGTAMAKEIKKMEENLYSRIGRLVGKELDKQHQRLEEVRVSEQAADFARQEKILKLISSELTKNTTRVVEMAVKSEVQNSVLPALETITKNEVKAALSGQIAKGLGDTMNQALPSEIERLLLRPDVSSHVARTFSSAITPVIERHVKDAISQTLIPAYTQQSSSMHQELSREMHTEMLNIKKEVIAWQSEALRGQESLIRELEQSVRAMGDQVKYLSMNASLQPPPQARHSPGPAPSGPGAVVPFTQQYRQVGPSGGMQPQIYGPPPPQQQQLPPPQQGVHGPWFPSGMAAPQASHPALPPPAPAPVHHSPPVQPEEWDDTYLAVLGTQDLRQLRELLARSNPDIVMPLNGPPPLSQAVILTLVHRLGAAIGESAPVDESFKSSLWWLQRAAMVLNTNDPLISPYVARVLPNVQQMLNTTKQRIAILPGGPQLLETARSISDIQDVLSHKPN